jgi:UDP-N-acetylglucosamine--N-acetylmuramyl-(pentapeptide) pyrophosphoryl-undecaprenol N-acetylglucosamine transferase
VPREIPTADREAARSRFGIGEAERCLLVFGGSQGAHSINVCAVEAFTVAAAESPRLRVLHISGHRDYTEMRTRLEAAPRADGYTLLEYQPNLADPLAASDLVLARSGGSIFEIAAAGRPAILVPYPHAAGRHQHANAEWMVRGGAAVVLEDTELDPARLREVATELLADDERLARMSGASRALARPEAAERIAAEVLAAIEQASGR